MEKMINLKEVFMNLGYTERSWKGQKSRLLKGLVDNPKDTFMVDEKTLKELLTLLAESKSSKYKGVASLMLQNATYKDMTNQYIEETKKATSKKDCKCIELEKSNKRLKERLGKLETLIKDLKSTDILMMLNDLEIEDLKTLDVIARLEEQGE